MKYIFSSETQCHVIYTQHYSYCSRQCHDNGCQRFIPQIQFLDSVPDIHMHEHVQEFIDGLFCILGDERKEIRRQ